MKTIVTVKHCYFAELDDFSLLFWKGWIELKGCLVEADWDFVALSEQH